MLGIIYDLLIAQSDRATIIDWKTYPKPQTKKKLAQNWQTRLYLYILAETSPYLPEQLSMTYWFVKLPTKPKHHTFFYNQQLHQQTERDLNQLLTKLDSWLQQNNLDSFPHRHDCPYVEELSTTNSNLQGLNLSISYSERLQKEIFKITEIEI